MAAFWKKHAETEQPLRQWLVTARTAKWQGMAAVKAAYPKASVINRERVVFDICGGNYRLVVAFKFSAGIAWVKFIGTHQEYDNVDAVSVDRY